MSIQKKIAHSAEAAKGSVKKVVGRATRNRSLEGGHRSLTRVVLQRNQGVVMISS